jgi:hypothetical protein
MEKSMNNVVLLLQYRHFLTVQIFWFWLSLSHWFINQFLSTELCRVTILLVLKSDVSQISLASAPAVLKPFPFLMIEANLISKEVPMKYRLHQNIKIIFNILYQKRESISSQTRNSKRNEMKLWSYETMKLWNYETVQICILN